MTTPEVTFKINEEGSGACTHEDLRTTATNQFGINYRCSCGIALHVRYGEHIRATMRNEDPITQVRAAISGQEW